MSGAHKQIETIASLLREQSTIALATVDEHGAPCLAPLFYIADDELTLYWLSASDSLHSRNLARTPRASASVCRPTENWRDICGVQMHGSATAVMEQSRRKALVDRYCERFKLGSLFRLPISQCVLYAFQPDSFRMIDNSKHFGKKFEVSRGPEGWICTRQ
jgi:uncharacterized protein YhbP (UPF0306 family)